MYTASATCQHCGNTYVPHSLNAKYCSIQCLHAAYRRRRTRKGRTAARQDLQQEVEQQAQTPAIQMPDIQMQRLNEANESAMSFFHEHTEDGLTPEAHNIPRKTAQEILKETTLTREQVEALRNLKKV